MTDETTLSLRISSLFAGRSLLDFHTQRFKYQTCEEWRLEIGRGKVTVNGKAASADYLLRIDDIVAYSFVHTEPPVDMNIQIMHEEETFLVANKPGNLPSHSYGNYINNALIFLLQQRLADKGIPRCLTLGASPGPGNKRDNRHRKNKNRTPVALAAV